MPLVPFMPDPCHSRHSCHIGVMYAYFAAVATKRRFPLESTFRCYNGSKTARARTPRAGRKSARA
eukprot:6673548-Lingulodinium_polyedra.AAC.1